MSVHPQFRAVCRARLHPRVRNPSQTVGPTCGADRYYITVFAAFVGNSRDRHLIPPSHDMCLIFFLLLPWLAFAMPYGYVHQRFMNMMKMGRFWLVASVSVDAESVKDKEPMLASV